MADRIATDAYLSSIHLMVSSESVNSVSFGTLVSISIGAGHKGENDTSSSADEDISHSLEMSPISSISSDAIISGSDSK